MSRTIVPPLPNSTRALLWDVEKDAFVGKNVGKVSILHHCARVFGEAYIFLREVLRALPGGAAGRTGRAGEEEGKMLNPEPSRASERERRRPDTRERKRNRIHAVPRPHAEAGRRGSGAQRMRKTPARAPGSPGHARGRDPTSAISPANPALARGGSRRPRHRAWGTLRERPRHSPGPHIRHRDPPLSASRARRPRSRHRRLTHGSSTRLRRGWGGAGEGRRNSRSSWPRPCRRSAPPARPAGLSAPVARDPPSSRAGSGRARKPGRPEGSEGSCAAAGAVCRRGRPRSG